MDAARSSCKHQLFWPVMGSLVHRMDLVELDAPFGLGAPPLKLFLVAVELEKLRRIFANPKHEPEFFERLELDIKVHRMSFEIVIAIYMHNSCVLRARIRFRETERARRMLPT